MIATAVQLRPLVWFFDELWRTHKAESLAAPRRPDGRPQLYAVKPIPHGVAVVREDGSCAVRRAVAFDLGVTRTTLHGSVQEAMEQCQAWEDERRR